MYKNIMAALVLSVLAVSYGAESYAQSDYPNRQVKVIVPFLAGGAAPDMIARLLSQRLSDRLKQQFVVENRAGAGGNIGVDAAAKSAPDGYTLLVTGDFPLTINPSVYPKLPFDPVKDFVPISMIASAGLALFACPKLQASTIPELLALARERPGKLTYASSGFGSNHHLTGEMLKSMAKVNLTHVPYKGFPQGVTDAISCQVDLLVGSIAGGLPHVKAGRLKALAVTSTKRHYTLPDTPTFIEAGFPGFEVEFYMGILAPAGTPKGILDKLHTEVSAILKEKEVIDRLEKAGLTVAGSTPQEFAARLASDTAAYGKVARSVGLRIE